MLVKSVLLEQHSENSIVGSLQIELVTMQEKNSLLFENDLHMSHWDKTIQELHLKILRN